MAESVLAVALGAFPAADPVRLEDASGADEVGLAAAEVLGVSDASKGTPASGPKGEADDADLVDVKLDFLLTEPDFAPATDKSGLEDGPLSHSSAFEADCVSGVVLDDAAPESADLYVEVVDTSRLSDGAVTPDLLEEADPDEARELNFASEPDLGPNEEGLLVSPEVRFVDPEPSLGVPSNPEANADFRATEDGPDVSSAAVLAVLLPALRDLDAAELVELREEKAVDSSMSVLPWPGRGLVVSALPLLAAECQARRESHSQRDKKAHLFQIETPPPPLRSRLLGL